MATVQYNSPLVSNGSIRGLSREKLYKELDLETHQHRPWYKNFGAFIKLPL